MKTKKKDTLISAQIATLNEPSHKIWPIMIKKLSSLASEYKTT